MNNLKFIIKKDVGISKRGIVKENLYEIFECYKFRIFLGNFLGLPDNFFLFNNFYIGGLR